MFLPGRVAAIILTAACLGASALVLRIARGHLSMLQAAAVAVAVGLGIAFLAVAFGPNRWWSRMLTVVTKRQGVLAGVSLPQHRATGRTLLFVSAVTYVVLLARFLPLNQTPHGDDQQAFLSVASEIRDRGGPPGLIRDLYSGEFSEANRHPLYLSLLSLSPDFASGKRLSMVIGCLSLLILAAMVARRFGLPTAGLFAVLLVTNKTFLLFSTRVVCEGLLLLLCGAAWLLTIPVSADDVANRSRRAESLPGVESSTTLRVWQTIWIGLLLGLAWLTKGSGLLLVFGTIAAIILSELCVRRIAQSRRRLLLLLAILTVTFCVTASPLLVRNMRRFGQPFYNVNSQLLFADRFVDPVQLAAEKTTRQAASDYFASHSLGDVFYREASGLVWETFIVLRSLGPSPLDESRFVFGIVILLSGIVGLASDPRLPRTLTVLWIGIFLFVFAWYVPIAAGERFVLPLLVPLLVSASNGLLRISQTMRAARETRLASEPAKF